MLVDERLAVRRPLNDATGYTFTPLQGEPMGRRKLEG